jgi:hypothetical protein
VTAHHAASVVWAHARPLLGDAAEMATALRLVSQQWKGRWLGYQLLDRNLAHLSIQAVESLRGKPGSGRG